MGPCRGQMGAKGSEDDGGRQRDGDRRREGKKQREDGRETDETRVGKMDEEKIRILKGRSFSRSNKFLKITYQKKKITALTGNVMNDKGVVKFSHC